MSVNAIHPPCYSCEDSGVRMGEALPKSTGLLTSLEEALRLTTEAIVVLDAAGAPGHIAAHLDLAAHRITKAIEKNTSD